MSTRYLGGFITKSPTAPTTSAAPGIWTLDQALGYIKAGTWPVPLVPSSQSYTTAGTFTWVAPAGVTSVSVVAVGGRGDTTGCVSGGGGLGYKNNYSVTPGSSYSVQVGGSANSGTSFFVSSGVVAGFGTSGATGGSYVGDGGGNGGNVSAIGGGGAGGYSGNGGTGNLNITGGTGSGGGGGGGSGALTPCSGAYVGSGGGGVGLFGQGANGAGGTSSINPTGGGGGSGGGAGTNGQSFAFVECCVTYYLARGGSGGAYGGGKGRGCGPPAGSSGGGAVRIVWPGNTRTFPSTCVGAP